MKKVKKLMLSRETLRRLATPELRHARGGESAVCMTGDCPTAETPCDVTVTTCPTDACSDIC